MRTEDQELLSARRKGPGDKRVASPMAVATETLRCYILVAIQVKGKQMTIETSTYDLPVDALVALLRALIMYEQRYQPDLLNDIRRLITKR